MSGEAGVGKTTVIDLLLARLAAGSAIRIGRGQCVEHYSEGEPYLPVLEALGQLSRGPHGQEILTVLRRAAPMWLVHLPGLVSDTELERLQRQVQGVARARMVRELADALAVLTADTPLNTPSHTAHAVTNTAKWRSNVSHENGVNGFVRR